MRELREVDAGSWDAALEVAGLRDVYARRAYVAASCLLDDGAPTLLEAAGPGGRVLFPLILREVPGTGGRLRDVTTPYGYGGPVASGPNPPWREFREGYARWCERRRVITSFVRYHPLYANHVDADPSEDLVPLAGTVGWRLDGGRDLGTGLHPHHRRQVRRARERGVRVVVAERPASLDGFRTLYEATMRRRNAAGFYFFGPAYWESLEANLRDRLVLVEGRLDGRVVAAALALSSPSWLHYHLGATDDAGRAVGASHLVLLEAARWAQARGDAVFHLGGGLGGRDDALLTFKRRFDQGGLLPAFVGRRIHDAAAYRALTGTDELAAFFPAYRDPSTAAARATGRSGRPGDPGADAA